jgi:hypothetical protein
VGRRKLGGRTGDRKRERGKEKYTEKMRTSCLENINNVLK